MSTSKRGPKGSAEGSSAASTSQISKGTPPVDDKTPDVNKRKRQSGPDSPRKRVMTAWTGDELELLFNQVTEGRRGKDLNVPVALRSRRMICGCKFLDGLH